MTITAELAVAVKEHQSGNITAAETAYRQILRVDPNHVDALHLSGLIALQSGKPDVAAELIGRALAVQGADPKLYTHLGAALRASGRPDDAIDAYHRALHLDPGFVKAHFNLGIALASQGKYAEALAAYRHAIQYEPNSAEAYHNAGIVLQRLGDLPAALQYFEEAVRIQPRYSEAHFNWGNALRLQGHWRKSVVCYDRALELTPHNAEIHVNRGSALQAGGQLDEAALAYLRALQLRPELLAGYNNLGMVRHAQGYFEEAAECYRKALALDPQHVVVLNNLGVTLESLVQLDAAIEQYEAVLRIDPLHREALNNLGVARQLQGNLDQAEALFHETLHISPGYAEAHYNLGNLRKVQGKLPEAIECYRQAVPLQPGYLAALNNMGTLYQFQGRLDEAGACFEQVLVLKPDSADAYNNLGTVFQHQGKNAEALAAFRRALEISPANSTAQSNVLIGLNYDPDVDPQTLFAEHQCWDDQYGRPLRTIAPHFNQRDPGRRLRIGYVSPDFRVHPVASFLEPILVHHDRRQFEVFCYAEIVTADLTTARFRELASEWRDTSGVSDAQLELGIRSDRIDILIDLAGHTAGNRLTVFARKPAPVQVTYLGYCNTSGLVSMDYRLTDPVADPPGEPRLHTEQLVRLPQGFCCYSPPEICPAVSPLPAHNSGTLTFGALHNLAKLNHYVIHLWAELLHSLPGSRLILARHALTPPLQAEIRRQFFEHEIPAERIEFRRVGVANNEHLTVYRDVDIALDVFPWSGHTTACEALWMGIPVLTLWGVSHRQRMVASVLTQIGLGEFIARTPLEYLEIAANASRNLRALQNVRSGLRQAMAESTLLDGASFTRQLEAVYRAMWQAWCGEISRLAS